MTLFQDAALKHLAVVMFHPPTPTPTLTASSKLVGYCLPVQGDLLTNTRELEKGAVVNTCSGRLAQATYRPESFLQSRASIPQCHSLPAPVTKSSLKLTLYALFHPFDPDALSPFWLFL